MASFSASSILWVGGWVGERVGVEREKEKQMGTRSAIVFLPSPL